MNIHRHPLIVNRRSLYRLINYLFGLNLIYLFVLEGKVGDHALILLGLVLSILAAYVAFLSNWISLEATRAVIILGTMVLGFGGWIYAAAVVFFFVVSSFFTRLNDSETSSEKSNPAKYTSDKWRRDGYQVWANGFWMGIFCILWFALGSVASFIAAFAVVAAATADTWATEIGTLKPGKTWKITTFERVEPGTDGGISVKGTLAALMGSLIIALFIFLTGLLSPTRFFFIIFLTGFAGSMIDSIVGALFLEKNVEMPTPSDYSSSNNSFTNSFVNWASIGLSGLFAYLITLLLFLL